MITQAYLHASLNYNQLILNLRSCLAVCAFCALECLELLNTANHCIYHCNYREDSCERKYQEGIYGEPGIKSGYREYKERYHHHKEKYVLRTCLARIYKEYYGDKEERPKIKRREGRNAHKCDKSHHPYLPSFSVNKRSDSKAQSTDSAPKISKC